MPISPVVLSVAGSDSGGEAGIQADLRTFSRLKAHGVFAVTALTAQNRAAISRIEPTSPAIVRAQLEAVAAEYRIAAAKTGMLCTAAIVREVVSFFRERRMPLVVDPVLVSTSGRILLDESAVKVLQRHLLPLATLATPNIPEAETLLGIKITTLEEARAAARLFRERYGCAALIKGGHLPGGGPAADFLRTAEGEWLLQAARASKVRLHGTGCVYSATIAAWLAWGKSLSESVALAKTFITQHIHNCAALRKGGKSG